MIVSTFGYVVTFLMLMLKITVCVSPLLSNAYFLTCLSMSSSRFFFPYKNLMNISSAFSSLWYPGQLNFTKLNRMFAS